MMLYIGGLMIDEFTKVPARKYAVGVFTAMGIYAAVVVVSIYWLHSNPPAPWKYLIAVLPILPALYVPVAAARFFSAMDELQRRIQLEGLAFGFVGAAVLTLSYGFLENAGLPQLNWVWVWPVMATCWIVGLGFAHRRYR
jgi:hypothetical protein